MSGSYLSSTFSPSSSFTWNMNLEALKKKKKTWGYAILVCSPRILFYLALLSGTFYCRSLVDGYAGLSANAPHLIWLYQHPPNSLLGLGACIVPQLLSKYLLCEWRCHHVQQPILKPNTATDPSPGAGLYPGERSASRPPDKQELRPENLHLGKCVQQARCELALPLWSVLCWDHGSWAYP